MQTATANALNIMEVLNKVNPFPIGHQELRESLYHIAAFLGVAGLLNSKQLGDCGKAAFSILRLDDPVQPINGHESTIVHSWVHT